MSPEVHGALVGGALGGVVVLAGVWTESWLSARRDRVQRRHRLAVEGADVLNRARPLVCAGGLLAVSPGSAQGQAAISEVQKVFDLGLEVFHSTKRIDPRGPAIRREAIDFVARWRAACDALHSGEPFSLDQLNSIDLAALRCAIWGRRNEDDIQALVDGYRERGFGIQKR